MPETGSVRHMAARPGLSLDLQQQLAPGLGAFLRAGANDGHKETYEFTEIDRTVSLGLALAGTAWDRPDDTVGLAGVVNGLSRDARAYFAAGGLGILIGDGRLPDYADERILESYYRLSVADRLDVTLDCQLIAAPAYNAERGPVTVIGARLHVEI